MTRGAFIVFEGLDRCGKTTQCLKLVEALKAQNLTCQMQRFPDRTTAVGKLISDYLTKQVELEDHAVHLLFTANRWETAPKIRELLKNGTTVIVDRYSYSGVVYTAAKKGFDMEWCKQPEIGLPKPDLVLFLSMNADNFSKRSNFGEERYESPAFQSAVLKNYMQLKDSSWKEIDASLTIDAVHDIIKEAVIPVIKSASDQPIGLLWTDKDLNQNKLKGPIKIGDNQPHSACD